MHNATKWMKGKSRLDGRTDALFAKCVILRRHMFCLLNQFEKDKVPLFRREGYRAADGLCASFGR